MPEISLRYYELAPNGNKQQVSKMPISVKIATFSILYCIRYCKLLTFENDQNEISIMYGFAHSRGFRIILSHFNGSVLRGAMTTNVNVFCTLRRQISPIMAFWTIYIPNRNMQMLTAKLDFSPKIFLNSNFIHINTSKNTCAFLISCISVSVGHPIGEGLEKVINLEQKNWQL